MSLMILATMNGAFRFVKRKVLFLKLNITETQYLGITELTDVLCLSLLVSKIKFCK